MESIESDHGCLLQIEFVCFSLIETFDCSLPNNPSKHNFHNLCENSFYIFFNSNEPEHVSNEFSIGTARKDCRTFQFSGTKILLLVE